jgi:hypothetical protein
VNTVMNLQALQTSENFLSNWGILLSGVSQLVTAQPERR